MHARWLDAASILIVWTANEAWWLCPWLRRWFPHCQCCLVMLAKTCHVVKFMSGEEKWWNEWSPHRNNAIVSNGKNSIWKEYNLRNVGGGNIAHPSILAEAWRRKKQKESPQNYDHAPYVLLLTPQQFWLKCKLTGAWGVATLMPSLNNVSLKYSFAIILKTKKQVFLYIFYLPIL